MSGAWRGGGDRGRAAKMEEAERPGRWAEPGQDGWTESLRIREPDVERAKDKEQGREAHKEEG